MFSSSVPLISGSSIIFYIPLLTVFCPLLFLSTFFSISDELKTIYNLAPTSLPVPVRIRAGCISGVWLNETVVVVFSFMIMFNFVFWKIIGAPGDF